MFSLLRTLQSLLNKTVVLDCLAPLLLRLYLVPIFWMAGTKKLENFDSTVAWFGNSEWGLRAPDSLRNMDCSHGALSSH